MDDSDYEYYPEYYEEANYSYYDQNDSSVCENPSREERMTCEKLSLIFEGYLSSIIAVVGLFANIMAISVFCRKTLRTNFTHLLVALAVFDFLFLLLTISENVRRNFEPQIANASHGLGHRMTRVHHSLFPLFLYPVSNILLSCSILMTVSISIERYLALFHPVVYKYR